MKIIHIILSFFLIGQATAQPIEKVTSLLKKKDFVNFKNFIDRHPKTNVDINWEILRDVIPGYQEGIVRITEYPLAGRDTDYTIHNYEIKLLSTEKSIFYYVFNKSYGKEIGNDNWKYFYSLIDSFNNSIQFADFKKAFSEGYRAELDENDLFITSIVYGNACGIGGQPPEFQLKLDALLENKDAHTIRKWLKSGNSEKQLFAIQGLRKMKGLGQELTPEDTRIIQLISKKNGLVNTCSGCIFSSDTIKKVVEEMQGLSSYGYRTQRKPFKKEVIYTGLAIIITLAVLLYLIRKRQVENP